MVCNNSSMLIYSLLCMLLCFRSIWEPFALIHKYTSPHAKCYNHIPMNGTGMIPYENWAIEIIGDDNNCFACCFVGIKHFYSEWFGILSWNDIMSECSIVVDAKANAFEKHRKSSKCLNVFAIHRFLVPNRWQYYFIDGWVKQGFILLKTFKSPFPSTVDGEYVLIGVVQILWYFPHNLDGINFLILYRLSRDLFHSIKHLLFVFIKNTCETMPFVRLGWK